MAQSEVGGNTVTLVVDRAAIRCPLGLRADELHDGLPKVVALHGLKERSSPQSLGMQPTC